MGIGVLGVDWSLGCVLDDYTDMYYTFQNIELGDYTVLVVLKTPRPHSRISHAVIMNK